MRPRQTATSLSVQLLPGAQTARLGPVLLARLWLGKPFLSEKLSAWESCVTTHVTARCGELQLLVSSRVVVRWRQHGSKSRRLHPSAPSHVKTRHGRRVTAVAQKDSAFQNTFLSSGTPKQWLAVVSEDPEPDKLSIEAFTHWDRPHLSVTTRRHRCPHAARRTGLWTERQSGRPGLVLAVPVCGSASVSEPQR